MNSMKIKSDRSAVSTILVIVVVAIVVIAAVAAYVVLSNDEKTRGVGTTFTYDISGEVMGYEVGGTSTMEYIGQNNDSFFVMQSYDMTMAGEPAEMASSYTLVSKETGEPKDAKKEGTTEINTVDGKKTVEIWSYSLDADGLEGSSKVYIDPVSAIEYRSTLEMEIQVEDEVVVLRMVAEYAGSDVVYQKSYKQSDNIGKKFEYNMVIAGEGFSYVVECVADCKDGKYGMSETMTIGETSMTEYLLADTPQGLYVGAANPSNVTQEVNTIDGKLTLEIWSGTYEGVEMYFALSSDTGIIYLIEAYSGSTRLFYLELESY